MDKNMRFAAIAVAIVAVLAAFEALWQIHLVSARLTDMDDRLTLTNKLLQQTNSYLATMVTESRVANVRLSVMQTDLGVMSHKLSGSFLFRGVK